MSGSERTIRWSTALAVIGVAVVAAVVSYQHGYEVVRAHGLPAEDDDSLTDSLRAAAHDRARYGEVWTLAEALVEHDELAASWRARHVVMVERMIGAKTGTGGSTGAAYLRTRLDLRYYPLLWKLRSFL